MKFSLIIPAKNEEKRILLPLLDYYASLYRRFGAGKFEIIIIVNNTSDSTVSSIKRLKKVLRCKELRIYDIGAASGKGESILYGMRKAKGKIVGFIDADGSSSGQELVKMYRWLDSHDNADAVIASRYMKHSHIIGDRPLERKIASKILHSLIKMLFRTQYHDFFCGLKLFRKNTINTLLTQTTAYGWGFDISVIISLLRNDFIIKEIPTSWTDKADSKVSLMRYGYKVLRELLTVYVKQSPKVKIAPEPITI